jgi:hypothetical protein
MKRTRSIKRRTPSRPPKKALPTEPVLDVDPPARPPNPALQNDPVPSRPPLWPPPGSQSFDDGQVARMEAERRSRFIAALPQANNVEASSEQLVVVSTGGAPLEIRAPEIGRPTLREKKATRSPRARTTIGKAVLTNRPQIELVGASFLVLIDERLETLRQGRPNSREARAATDAAIADLEDLKRRVEAFLGAAAQFSVSEAKEKAVVENTNWLTAGIRDWWSKRHVQACDKAFDKALKAIDVGALFGIGVAICSLAGADPNLGVAISGAMVGGKHVVDVIKALAKGDHLAPK